MTERIRQLWAERSPREQQLLLVMFALFALVVIGLGIVRPLTRATEIAEARLDRITLEAGQVRAAADRLRLAQKDAPAPINVALSQAVSSSAASAGFALTMVDVQGEDRVAITIPSARSPALFAWFASLARQGIFVERLTVRTSPGATLAADVTLRLRGK